MHLEVIIFEVFACDLLFRKTHVFRRKKGCFASAGTDGAGCQDLAEGPPQRGAKRVFTHGAVLAVVAVALACGLLGFCCGNVGGAWLYGRLPSEAPFP